MYLGTFIIMLSTIYLQTFLTIQYCSKGKSLIPISFTDFFSPNGHVPRQLIFHWGSNPSISWDWWLDPKSSAHLVREEFKYICVQGTDDHFIPRSQWENLWPLSYPEWSDPFCGPEDGITYPNRQLLYKRVQERANRRLKKKSMKAARAQGLNKRECIPGAWPV